MIIVILTLFEMAKEIKEFLKKNIILAHIFVKFNIVCDEQAV